MTDFQKIAADGFEMNARVLDENSNDAVARSYMLGVIMAKHLTDDHVIRAKRYITEYNYGFSLSGSLGYKTTSLTLSIPISTVINLSNPNPQPECGGIPHPKDSK